MDVRVWMLAGCWKRKIFLAEQSHARDTKQFLRAPPIKFKIRKDDGNYCQTTPNINGIPFVETTIYHSENLLTEQNGCLEIRDRKLFCCRDVTVRYVLRAISAQPVDSTTRVVDVQRYIRWVQIYELISSFFFLLRVDVEFKSSLEETRNDQLLSSLPFS